MRCDCSPGEEATCACVESAYQGTRATEGVVSYGTPVRPIRTIVHNDDPVGYSTRILCGTPTRGTVRIEWHNAFRGMVTPTNWSMVSMCQPMSTYIPVRFQVADAQNLIVRELLEKDFEWMLLLEDDVIPPPDLLIKLNRYMQKADTPVVSGLYFTKSEPSEPLIYKGRGAGAFVDFNIGEKVWCDGVPTGCLLVHHSLLRAMWEDSEEYMVGGFATRRVFESAVRSWIDPETGSVSTKACTSDLDWCWRIIDGDYMAKAGWTKLAGNPEPFVVDTSIMCQHIDPHGRTFPERFVTVKASPPPPPDLGVAVSESAELSEQVG